MAIDRYGCLTMTMDSYGWLYWWLRIAIDRYGGQLIAMEAVDGKAWQWIVTNGYGW